VKSTGIARAVSKAFDHLLELKGLTPRQADVLRVITARLASGIPASVRDLQSHFGFKNPNGAYVHLKALAKKGKISLRGTTRSILPTGITITLSKTPKGESR